MRHEILDMDVLFVGAGPASLAGAIHLSRLVKLHNDKVAAGSEKTAPLEISIGVIEKGSKVGSHAISGAVIDPIALRELIPDFETKGAPLESPVVDDRFVYLTQRRSIVSPITPPPLNNHGCYVASLNKLVRWLGEIAEQSGVGIFPEFPGAEMLYDGDRVIGVRTGDKGIDRNGERKPNFEPGVDIHAKVTVLGEGSRGSLAKQLISKLRLDVGRNPQVYAIGVKEIWELPKGTLQPGHVTHTMGFPLKRETYGGGFIYSMNNDLLDIGFVVGLDYRDPLLDGHEQLQRFKTHPFVAEMLRGGKLVEYGAKSIPVGGYWSVPKLFADGVLLIGDTGSLLNAMRLKGIHHAMKSGMLAAEAIFQSLLKQDYSEAQLKLYDTLVRSSWIEDELHRVRNFHQGFQHGQWAGLVNAGLQLITRGRGWGIFDRLEAEAGHAQMRKLNEYYSDSTKPAKMKYDGDRTFDKVSDLYVSGTKHEENQPVHLKVADLDICHNRCTTEFGNPCQHFCPANVYEMIEREGGGGKRLQINAANCVHCKTCDIMDPYQIINWVTPEGGGGPQYVQL